MWNEETLQSEAKSTKFKQEIVENTSLHNIIQ